MHTPKHDAVVAFAPGRTELAGNHTDHQGGMTISATVEQGVSITLRKRPDLRMRITSADYKDIDESLESLEPQEHEARTTAALARGVCAALSARGVVCGGFDTVIESSIEPGGGLSSSAAVELAFAKGLDVLYGTGELTCAELAAAGCFSEQRYFGKPCGLQDQTAIAYGGISLIDYSVPGTAKVQTLDADFASAGIDVVLVSTGCDHSLHTDDFAKLVQDMHDVARLFGAERLGEVDEDAFLAQASRIRETLSDRAYLRALHYYNEMRLVRLRAKALQENDYAAFLELTAESGASSAELLQNISVPGAADQTASVVYGTARHCINRLEAEGFSGACRIHGGGFGGSVQAFVSHEALPRFVAAMERVAGTGCCTRVAICSEGVRASWL